MKIRHPLDVMHCAGTKTHSDDTNKAASIEELRQEHLDLSSNMALGLHVREGILVPWVEGFKMLGRGGRRGGTGHGMVKTSFSCGVPS